MSTCPGCAAPQTIPEVGQLYQPFQTPEVLWVVMEVDPSHQFPIKARRCDASDQTHIGRWSFELFAQTMELVQVVPAPSTASSRPRTSPAIPATAAAARTSGTRTGCSARPPWAS